MGQGATQECICHSRRLGHKWRPPSLSELTQIIFKVESTQNIKQRKKFDEEKLLIFCYKATYNCMKACRV